MKVNENESCLLLDTIGVEGDRDFVIIGCEAGGPVVK